MSDKWLAVILILSAALMASNPDHEASTWRNLTIAAYCCFQAGICWQRNNRLEESE